MALQVDSSGTSTASGIAAAASSVTTGNFNTAAAGRIVICVTHAEWANAVGAHGVVASIVGGGLTWAKRASATLDNAGNGSAYNDMEVWWAYAAAKLTNITVTATWTTPGGNNPDAATVLLAGISGFTGTSYQTNPWDANGSLPKIATSGASSAPTITGVSTSSPADMLIWAVGVATNSTTPTHPTGWSNFIHNNIAGAANGSAASLQGETVAVTQSNITITTASTLAGWLVIGDALAQAGSASASPPIPWYQRRSYLKR
jgi:hypothetical protein